jgi:tRNA nucleotidyltransferase (CCA-adding enzyme)
MPLLISETQIVNDNDIEELLGKSLPPPLDQVLSTATALADEIGYASYLVGGVVRDWLLGKENLDLDLVIEGDGLIFAERLARLLKARFQLHKRYLTATIFLPGSFKLDIATTRTEHYPQPAALPKVRKGTLQEDLFRRDFTINTLAIKLNGPNAPCLVDIFGGLRDLRAGVIRVLHERSFIDDPSRILRALRFEQRFDFSLEKDTLACLQEAVEKAYIALLPGSRFFQEIFLLLNENTPIKYITRMADFDLLKFIHHKITLSPARKSLLSQVEEALQWYMSHVAGAKLKEWLVYFLSLVDGLAEPDLWEMKNRLVFPLNHFHKLLQDKNQVEIMLQSLGTIKKLKPSQLVDNFKSLSPEALILLWAKVREDSIRKEITCYLTRYSKIKPRVTGQDLINLGLTPGPLFREILHKLQELKLDGLLTSKREELEYIKKTWKKEISIS